MRSTSPSASRFLPPAVLAASICTARMGAYTDGGIEFDMRAKKSTDTPGLIVVVQQIHTTWTKISRGGEGAARRNGVPEVARVPVHRVQALTPYMLLHELFYTEWSAFTNPIEKLTDNPDCHPLRLGGVIIDFNDEEVRAAFAYSRECGAPDRGWMRKTLALGVNEWGQISYNGRFSGESGWWYEKTVVNVGLFERPSDSIFTRTEPTQRYSVMDHLL